MLSIFLIVLLILMIAFLPKNTVEDIQIKQEKEITQEDKARVCLEEKNFDYECSLYFLNQDSLKLCYELEGKQKDSCIFIYANTNNILGLCEEIDDLDIKNECIENLKETILPGYLEE